MFWRAGDCKQRESLGMILSVWQNWDIGQTWEDKNENKRRGWRQFGDRAAAEAVDLGR